MVTTPTTNQQWQVIGDGEPPTDEAIAALARLLLVAVDKELPDAIRETGN